MAQLFTRLATALTALTLVFYSLVQPTQAQQTPEPSKQEQVLIDLLQAHDCRLSYKDAQRLYQEKGLDLNELKTVSRLVLKNGMTQFSADRKELILNLGEKCQAIAAAEKERDDETLRAAHSFLIEFLEKNQCRVQRDQALQAFEEKGYDGRYLRQSYRGLLRARQGKREKDDLVLTAGPVCGAVKK